MPFMAEDRHWNIILKTFLRISVLRKGTHHDHINMTTQCYKQALMNKTVQSPPTDQGSEGYRKSLENSKEKRYDGKQVERRNEV